MTNVTFVQTSGGNNSVTVCGKIVYGTDFYLQRLNNFKLLLADGTVKVYDAGPTKVSGVIVMKNISIADKENMLTWIKDRIVFGKYTFRINAVSGINWGCGINTAAGMSGGAISDCYYIKNDTDELFEYVAPGLYTMKFEYSFILST